MSPWELLPDLFDEDYTDELADYRELLDDLDVEVTP